MSHFLRTLNDQLHDERRDWSIDVLKGLAVIAVIAQHTLDNLDKLGGVFWIFPAMPVFMVLFGYNSYNSEQRRRGRDHDAQSTSARVVVVRRLRRLLIPFAMIWIVSAVVGIATGDIYLGPTLLMGILPTPGAGNYFIAVIITATVLYPFVHTSFLSQPLRTTIVVTLIDLGFSLLGPFLSHSHEQGIAIYYAAVLRYGVAIVLGMWIARLSSALFLRTRATWIAFAISVSFLATTIWWPHVYSWWVQGFTLSTNLFAAPYAAVVVACVMNIGGRRFHHRTWTPIRLLGIASFHVFLVQIIWTGFVVEKSIALFITTLVACSVLGVILAALTQPASKPANAA